MEQIVTVRALYPDGTAEVACRRASACSGDCGHCGGCTNAQTVLVRAYNPIGAKPGDRVVVEIKGELEKIREQIQNIE